MIDLQDVGASPAAPEAAESPRDRSGRMVAAGLVAVSAVVAAVLLYSLSVPGVDFWWFLAASALLLSAGIVCGFLLLQYVVRRVRGHRPPFPRYLALMLVLAVSVAGAALADLPLRARFELSRASFDEHVQDVLTAADGVPTDRELFELDAAQQDVIAPSGSTSIGSFVVSRVRVIPEGVLMYEQHGAFLDDAGFAYLPDGRFPPGDGSFENPQFRSLGGGWYSFTSSW